MANITEQELKRSVSEGRFAPLYLMVGEEKLTLKRAARRLISKASGENFPEFNRGEFTNDSEIESIAAAVEALPFMAERKCVAVSDFDPDTKPQAELDRLCELLEDLPDSTVLVFYYPTVDAAGQKSAKWKKFLKAAGKAGHTVNFPRLEKDDLRRALTSEAQRQGCVLSRESFQKLLEYAGNDLHLLRGELDKLCAYALGQAGADRELPVEITPAMVEELTPKSTDTTAFMMVGALVAGRYEQAFGLLDQLFYQNVPPVAVLGAMASAYIDMYRVKSALESGLTAFAPAEYASDYKNREFRLRNAERGARGLSSEALKTCLDLLLDADMALKGSRLEPRLVLEGLVARLLLAVQR